MGDLSYKVYNQGDCEMFRYKKLSVISTNNRWVKEVESILDSNLTLNGTILPPNSTSEVILKQVCEYAENL